MRNRNKHLCLSVALVCLFAAIGLAAAEEAGAEPSAAVETNAVDKVDYGKAFQNFYKLGLPDVAEGQYVELNVFSSELNVQSARFYELDLNGNAWLLEENEDEVGKFVVNKSRIVEIYDYQKLQAIIGKESEEAEGEGGAARSRRNAYSYSDPKGRIGGQWEDADLEVDIQKTIDFLKKEKNDENRYSSLKHGSGSGSIFLAAIHYYSKGYEDQANEIVRLLIDIAGDHRQVVLQAFNQLADNQYEDVMESFVRERDFDALAKDLTRLLRKFSAGWRNGLVVKKVLEDVSGQLANPEPPEIAGLDPENAALANDLALAGADPDSRLRNQDAYYYGGRNSLWVLNSETHAGKSGADELNAIAKIKRRGIKSVPLLLKLIDDDYLTKIDSRKLTGRSSISYGWNSKLTEEMVEEIYRSFRRPLSRGDIAAQLLSTIPLRTDKRGYHSERRGKEDIKVLCEEWYARNKDKTPLELARFYLDSTDSRQQSVALSFLMKNGTASDFAIVEEKLLSRDQDYESMNLVRSYVDARGIEAKDFVERYAESLEGSENSDDDSMFKRDENKKHVQRQIKALKKIVNAPPPEELLADIVAGKKSLLEERDVLMRGLGRSRSDNELIEILLQAAIDAEDTNIRADLIGLMQTLDYAGYEQDPWSEEEESQDEDRDIATSAEKWKVLLADESVPRMGEPQQISIADFTAYAIEALYENDVYSLWTKLNLLDKDLYAILMSRARERLAGKEGDELTEIPSADNVDKERVKELVSNLESYEGDELVAFVNGLESDEILALAAEELDEDVGKKLAPYSLKIEKVFTDIDASGAIEKVDALIGRSLDVEMLKEIRQICFDSIQPGRMAQLNVIRDSFLGGVVITLYEFDSDTPVFRSQADAVADEFTESVASIVKGRLQGGNLYFNAQWEDKSQDAAEEAAAKSGSDDMMDELLAEEMDELENEGETRRQAQQEKFWEIAEKFINGECDVLSGGVIYFTGIPAPGEDLPKEKE